MLKIYLIYIAAIYREFVTTFAKTCLCSFNILFAIGKFLFIPFNQYNDFHFNKCVDTILKNSFMSKQP